MADAAVDVIVVGGGPAGSAAAAILARRGCRVVLLDRAVFPRAKPCGDYLNPGSDAVIARLGLRNALDAAGARPVRGMRIFAPDGSAVTLPFTGGSGWALPRLTLDHLLLMHAAGAGVTVIEGARAADIEQGPADVLVQAEHLRARRAKYTARLVIGADGLHSTVARAIGAGEPPRRGRYTVGAYLDGVVPDAAAAGQEIGELHLGLDRYCGVAHLPGGLANVTIALSRTGLRAWRGDLDARYWATLRTFPGLAGRLAHARRAGRFQTSGPLGYRRRRAASGRVLLAGDAAAHIDPLTGQGIYLALRGAELAAAAAFQALDHGGAAQPLSACPAAFHEYNRARRREFDRVFLVSRILQHLAFRPAVVHRATRRMAGRPDLGARLIAVVGNMEPAGSVLHPAFVGRVLGIAP